MTDILKRLRECVIADAFEQHHITNGRLADRLIRERLDAADEIERLRIDLSALEHLAVKLQDDGK